jgi:sec-independent protein translocase protein TatA
MGSLSIWHWVIVALIVLVLFGKGRISEMMGDLGKGIKSFKKGMVDEETNPAAASPKTIDQQVIQPATQPTGDTSPR